MASDGGDCQRAKPKPFARLDSRGPVARVRPAPWHSPFMSANNPTPGDPWGTAAWAVVCAGTT